MVTHMGSEWKPPSIARPVRHLSILWGSGGSSSLPPEIRSLASITDFMVSTALAG